jgi:hypothetical protein
MNHEPRRAGDAHTGNASADCLPRKVVLGGRQRLSIMFSCFVALALAFGPLATTEAEAASGMRFSVTPQTGVTGVEPLLQSIDTCPLPPEATNKWIEFSATDTAPGERSAEVKDDGTWSGIFDTTLLNVPIGTHEIIASCHAEIGSEDVTTATYDPVPWYVSGPQQPLQVTPATVTTRGKFTVSSTSPCPAGGPGAFANVEIKGNGASYSMGPAVPVATDGSWFFKVDLSAYRFDALPPGNYQAKAECGEDPQTFDGNHAKMPGMEYGSSNTLHVIARPVASLGDSYSSGEANAPFDNGTDMDGDTCHRSPDAWPRILGVAKVAHFACSGAVLRDLSAAQQKLWPDNNKNGQIGQLKTWRDNLDKKGIQVEEVTITIGGNDIGFSAIMGDCFVRECLAHPEVNEAKVKSIREPLTEKLRNIRSAANAQVYLVGYPRLFPAQQEDNLKCGWLTPRERIRANTLSDSIDLMQRQAAAAAGAQFISVQNALDGHELCTSDSWVYPINPPKYKKNPIQGHPIRAGQEAIADLVERRIP